MDAASVIEDGARPGLAGAWDRFVGPGQTPVELAGTVLAVGAGALWGDHALDEGASWPTRAAMRLAAVDLWGGLWVNNTRTCARWYERPGQGAVEHLGFAGVHIVHAGVVAGVDVVTGSRNVRSAVVWTLGHYGWMLASSMVTVAAPRRVRLGVATAATVGALLLDRVVGPSRAAPWFAPVFDGKLLIGHAAGGVWG